MSFTYEDKKIDSVFIDKIWHVLTTDDGVYTAGLDGNWDIIISRHAGSTSVVVNGIGKRAVRVPYFAGTESIGIALKPGVFLRDLKGKDIVDSQHVLAENQAYVEIGAEQFKIPTDFASAKVFVDELVDKGIIQINPQSTSERSLRRHVLQTTGLSPYFFHQIQRAQHATKLLQQGTPLAQAAIEAGYSDQAHMTKALKQFIGRTPSQITAERRKS